jgi:hypothetical protein
MGNNVPLDVYIYIYVCVCVCIKCIRVYEIALVHRTTTSTMSAGEPYLFGFVICRIKVHNSTYIQIKYVLSTKVDEGMRERRVEVDEPAWVKVLFRVQYVAHAESRTHTDERAKVFMYKS